MGTEDTLSLQRLLRPRPAAALLESFATLAPDLGLALIRPDRQRLASVGAWPNDTLHELSKNDADNGCRQYPLLAGAQPLGTLLARGELTERNGALECILHQMLSILLASAIEKREIAAEALQG